MQPSQSRFDPTTSAKDFEPQCDQGPDVGLCKGFFPMWWFNTKTGKCEEFVYGGCGGNGNRYETKEECEETCSVKTLPGLLDLFSTEIQSDVIEIASVLMIIIRESDLQERRNCSGFDCSNGRLSLSVDQQASNPRPAGQQPDYLTTRPQRRG
ncbi:hypothetical protein HPB51_026681 [Rhipicephalus microplus]|uniref:BPTI/Kunitz inhibitor domain-containing protein n=1 Tax=Rhipicephalus microplus TaxID=6941 RepID=A0A9J6D2H6_RHIMP|nr:hypothetical protein HPB51_026681 [Rhipicephalus microplus]